MTAAMNLIGAAIRGADDCPDLPPDQVDGICCLTGISAPTLPRKLVIGKSFTNLDLLAAPNSERIGVNAYLAMKYKWQRMSCWYVDQEFQRIDKPVIRGLVFNKREANHPWSGYVTTGYKKHGGLLAPVNTGNQNRWLFELRIVDCTDHVLVAEWWDVLNTALRNHIGRNSMENLEIPTHALSKVGVSTWLAFSEWAKPKIKTPLYAFLCYLLPSQEELKIELSGSNKPGANHVSDAELSAEGVKSEIRRKRDAENVQINLL